MKAMRPLWGIDLGGTKIEGVVLNSIDPLKIACRLRVPTEAEQGYSHILQGIVGLVVKLENACGMKRPARIGVGTPGTVNPATGLMKNCNTTCLNGRALREELALALGTGVEIANDANCFALAEALMGAGRGFPTVFGVILGTGVGGGIVIERKVVSGAQGIAGEWGHNTLDPEGLPCYCGQRGCVETVISGPALERYYSSLSHKSVPLAQIAVKARSGGDPYAIQTLERLCAGFGKAAAQVVNVLDPHVIVVGGGVGNIDEIYSTGRAALGKHVFNNRLETVLEKPRLGDSAGVLGAALLAST